MTQQPNAGNDRGGGQQSGGPGQKPRREFWRWFVLHMERKVHQRRARRAKKKSAENPTDEAAWRTASATIWIAIFTVVLAAVGVFTLIEVIGGGTDTHNLAVAAGNQATWTQRLADSTRIQSDRTQALADRMKDQADRTKDVADRTKIVAAQAVIQAGAAKSAAETANKALHISERAYVVAGYPSMNTTSDLVVVPIVNAGHIPSGKVTVIAHEATLPVANPDGPLQLVRPIEAHWKHYAFESVPTGGETLNINVSVPNGDAAQIKSGHQQVVIVGVVSYNDGFQDDPDQQWFFCFGNGVKPHTPDLQWAGCDSALYLAQLISVDHYPDGEYEQPD